MCCEARGCARVTAPIKPIVSSMMGTLRFTHPAG
jgi:hypothetical protein